MDFLGRINRSTSTAIYEELFRFKIPARDQRNPAPFSGKGISQSFSAKVPTQKGEITKCFRRISFMYSGSDVLLTRHFETIHLEIT